MELDGNLPKPERWNQPDLERTKDQHEARLQPGRCRGNSVREIPEDPAGKSDSSHLLGRISVNQSRPPIRGQRMHCTIPRWITPRGEKAPSHERNPRHSLGGLRHGCHQNG